MTLNMHVALPLYMYPSVGTWQPLYDALSNNPQVTFDVIVNPNNGPGGSLPDSNYIANITMINAHPNVNILGYVHTSYGSRDLSDIASDIDTYQSWSTYTNSNISLGGIFVDETPASLDNYDYMANIFDKVKSTMTNGNLVWTNPGVPVDASFYNIADMINAYENSYDHWMNQGGNSSIPAAVRSKSTVLLHSYPSNTDTMASDVDGLVDASYLGALLIVNDQYSSFDSMWPTFTSEVKQSNANMKC
ncbi:hypothetical protein AUEXF2481DRAFT_87898 [Aureobasidium subglaciale EXF-2481]|uniref:Glycoside hydrolase family 135 protein n=1 Tax=Aureobasidium subglaciale (strain EXF-2481) TaxID=1043005 RepID=A0A074YQX2_AURSE|nr:uncharacterized protein AUEXF2481DRAFT_87898 [Aureobasidium subglaciale EXF-2481]KEQ96512.1 hypothetical protein AUEXF2481DRAFT_87898 [Aureobasidium subglaciale EXF-2481]